MLVEGEKLGPYLLIEEIGGGGFGEVWLAEKAGRLATTRHALKVPRVHRNDLDRFKEEAQVWSRIPPHPNVHSITEAEVYGRYPVIVSEYAEEGSLVDWMNKHGGKAPS